MSYEVIDEGVRPHKCNLPKQGGMTKRGVQHPRGTIIACSDCGKYYYLTYWTGYLNGTQYGEWNKVRWYHFGKRKRIRGN